jgi:hypothetical protein
MKIQSLIPPALCAMHNFIRHYDSNDINDFEQDIDDLMHGDGLEDGLGELSRGAVSRHARERASNSRDNIAQAMWDQYTAMWDQYMASVGS